MELNHLRNFYEVARAGSFTSAAQLLRTSQSALSKSVAILEEREGVKLFERSKKGVTLTALGRDIFDHCLQIFSNVQLIQDRFHGATQKCEGYLRFGASDHLARYLLVEKLKRFRGKYQEVIPSLFVGAPYEIIEQVMRNDLEFGLFFTKINKPGLEYKRLGPFEMVLVAESQSFKNLTIETVAKVGIIGSISREFERHPSHRVFEFVQGAPRINHEVNSQELQKQLCLAGEGCALLARFMVATELKEKKLREINLTKPIFTDLLLVKRKNHVFTRPAQKFIDEVVLELNKKS